MTARRGRHCLCLLLFCCACIAATIYSQQLLCMLFIMEDGLTMMKHRMMRVFHAQSPPFPVNLEEKKINSVYCETMHFHPSDSRIICSSFLLNSFYSGGSQLVQSTCSLWVRFRTFSQFCCSYRYLFWGDSFLFHRWFVCCLLYPFRIASLHLYISVCHPSSSRPFRQRSVDIIAERRKERRCYFNSFYAQQLL